VGFGALTLASLRRKRADAAAAPRDVAGMDSPSVLPAASGAAAAESPAANVGVETLLKQIDTLRRAQEQQQKEAPTETNETRRKAWLASSQIARDNIAASNDLHRAALKSGLVDTSPEYFRFMDEQLSRQPAAGTAIADEVNKLAVQTAAREQPQRPEPNTASIVSAPVSREPPSSYLRRPSAERPSPPHAPATRGRKNSGRR